MVIGAIGTAAALWLLAGASGVVGPATTQEAAFTAVETLGGGTMLGLVLLAGRRVSPSAPLTSGLLWAAGSLVTLADPELSSDPGPGPSGILTLVAFQLGLALAAVMLFGTLAVQPSRSGSPQQHPVPGNDPDRDTDRNLPAVGPAAVHRQAGRGRRRPDGAGPRHRAAPAGPRVPSLVARRHPVPEQRRMPAMRRADGVPPAGALAPRRQWG